MSIPDGFKVSEVGVIPVDWEVKYLRDCLIKNPDYGINAAAVPYSDMLPTYIRITDISEDGNFLAENKVSVIHQNAHNYFLEVGDIVLARTGASTGKSYLYNVKDGKLVFAGFLIRVRPDTQKLYPRYLKGYLETQSYWNWVKVMSMRSGQPGINGNEYSHLKIPLPPLAEQKAIAQSLSDVDNLITAIDKLITKKRNIKQGTMQELLTGKKRLPGFTGEWEVKTFEEVLKVIDGDRGDNYPSNDELFNHGYCLFLSAKNVTREGFKFSECIFITKEKNDVLGKGKLVKKDLVLTTRGTVGNIAFFDDYVPFENIRINSGMVIIRNEYKNLDNIYIYSFLKSNFFQYQIDKVVFGSAQPQLTVKVISKFKIPLPPLPEQKAIAKILTEMDEEIEALEKKREKYKNIKQGMMQELLTGKTRLKINLEDR